MSPDEPLMVHLDWRLTELEKRFEANTAHIDRRFDALANQVAGLSFVRADVYAAEQRMAEAAHKALEQRIDDTDKRAMWAIGLVCAVTISAIIAGILSTAGVFG